MPADDGGAGHSTVCISHYVFQGNDGLIGQHLSQFQCQVWKFEFKVSSWEAHIANPSSHFPKSMFGGPSSKSPIPILKFEGRSRCPKFGGLDPEPQLANISFGG